MRLNAWPPAEVFDPTVGVSFAGFEELVQACPGRAALVVASARARREDWSGASVSAIADALGSRGRRVLVADLTFERTNLGDRLNVPNDEGLADVFLYGASLGHVIHRVPERSFDLIPPGAFVPDPAELMRDAGWDPLLEEILIQGRTLLVYAGAEVAGITALSSRIRDVIVLSSSGEAEAIAGLLADGCRVHGVLMPPAAPEPVTLPRPVRESPPSRREPDVPDEPTPQQKFDAVRVPRNAEREALIADLRARQRAALMAPPPVPPSAGEGSGASTWSAGPGASTGAIVPGALAADVSGEGVPEVAARRPGRRGVTPVAPPITEPTFVEAMGLQPRRKGRRALYFGLSFLTIAALIAGAWFVWRRQREQPAVPPATPQPAPVATPVSAVKLLPYAVAVEAHQHLPLAIERVEALRKEEPEIGFYIAPFLIANELWYRVLAGPVADSVSGSTLLRYLLEKQHKTGATPNDLRRDPLAFLIGEFTDESEARRRRESIEQLGIPGYIVPSVAPDGGALYRLYAGAYSGTAEANIMRQLLRSAGLPDSLVERTGRQE